jgi:hypothetical protein
MRDMIASVPEARLGWRLRDSVHRQFSRAPSGSSVVNV